MEFYNEKDLAYWRKQSELGKALIIEIPVRTLFDMDLGLWSQEGTLVTKIDDLQEWIDSNRAEIEEALEKEAEEKAAVEMLSAKLYGETDEKSNDDAGRMKEKTGSDDDAASKVASIMAKEVFTDEQIAVIGEAIMEELPDKYLLCFLKKEYTPAVMRQLKDYVTKLHREEMSRFEKRKP